MSRARAAWIAAAVVVLAVLAYVVRRHRAPVPATTVPELPVAPPPAEGISASEAAVAEKWRRLEEATAMQTEDEDVLVDGEQPLPTWARVAIVAVALLAFFAVSLIATKQV